MSKTVFNFNMSIDAITAGTVSIGRRTQSLRNDIHYLVVSIVRLWAEDGNAAAAAQRMTDLFGVIDENYRQAMVNWAKAYCDFDLVSEGKGDDKSYSFRYNRTTTDADQFQAAKAETMFDLTPAKKPVPAMDLRALVIALAERAEKKRVKGLSDDDNVPSDLIEGLRALVSDDES